MPVKTTVITDNFNRADGAPANNWTVLNSAWAIVSNVLQSSNANFSTDDCFRQASEAFLDGGIRAKLILASNTSNVLKVRYESTSKSAYWAWVNSGQLFMTMGQSTTATAFAGSASGTQFMTGNKTSMTTGPYIMELYAIKTSSGNKTTVVAKVYDSGGTVIQDMFASTDTTANLQVSLKQGLGPLGSGVGIDDFTTFTIPGRDGKTRNVIFEGDSITAGAQASAAKWFRPAQALDFLGNDWSGSNQGHAGDTIANITTDAPTQVDANFDGSKDFNWLSVLIGTNDLAASRLAATVYSDLKTYCQARKTANPTLKICVGTLIDRSETGLVAGWSIAATTVNASIAAALAASETWIDTIADYAADPRFTPGTGTSATTTWYNADHIHPIDAGYMQLAIIESEALRDYIAPSTSVGLSASLARPLRARCNRTILRL